MKTIIDWLEKLFNTDNNTAATIITSITVFLLGGLVAAFYQWLKLFRDKYYTRLVVLGTIKLLCDQLSKAITAYEAAHPKFELGDNMDFSFEDVTIGQIQILKEIGYISIDKAFRYRYNQKRLSKPRYELVDSLWNKVISLNQYDGMIHQKIGTFDTVFNANNEKLQQAVTAYLEYMFHLLGAEYQKNSRIAAYIQQLGIIHDNWQRAPNNSFPQHFERLIVKPTVDLNNGFMNQGFNPILFQSIMLLSNVNFQLENKRNILRSFKEHFKGGAEYFLKQQTSLSAIESDLRPALYLNLSLILFGLILITLFGTLGYVVYSIKLF